MSMQDRIIQALGEHFSPLHLEVQDESHMHSRGKESHYKAIIVSNAFAQVTKVRRHQNVYAALAELMPAFHALALHTFTPEEWEAAQVPDSPTCRGGSLNDV